MALATASGAGAIAVIRISGKEAFTITDKVFRAKGKKTVSEAESHTIIFGDVLDGEELVDEVLVSVFRNPKSFTGEDSVEISCHGSVFIQKRILNLLNSNAPSSHTSHCGAFFRFALPPPPPPPLFEAICRINAASSLRSATGTLLGFWHFMHGVGVYSFFFISTFRFFFFLPPPFSSTSFSSCRCALASSANAHALQNTQRHGKITGNLPPSSSPPTAPAYLFSHEGQLVRCC